jgi:methylmalonyl-CoA/ethylmalonyl-CoA epimerase
MYLAVDHVGIAVAELEPAVTFYRDVFGFTVQHEEANAEQGVREAMLGVGSGQTQLQLLAPLNEDSPIARFLDRSGPGVQHIAYAVDDVVLEAERLRARGLTVLWNEPRRGTRNSLVNFVHPRDAGGVLVELVQRVADPPLDGPAVGAFASITDTASERGRIDP